MNIDEEKNIFNDAKIIKDRYNGPIIGVLGGSAPDFNYNPAIGRGAGCVIGQYFKTNSGSVCTGGVPGVGVDFYSGLISTPVMKSDKDRFFVVYPESKHGPCEDYFFLSNKISKKLNVEIIGKNMLERREALSNIADVFIAINGSEGTEDEIIRSINKNKKVICIYGSGGAADFFINLKSRYIDFFISEKKKMLDNIVPSNLDNLHLNLLRTMRY